MDFPELLEQAKKSPDKTDFNKLRSAYTEWEGYNPAEKSDAWKDLEKGFYDDNMQEAEGGLVNILREDYMCLRAHQYAIILYSDLNNNEKMYHHMSFFQGLLDDLLQTGDGKTSETAFKVIDIDEEYVVLPMIQRELGMRWREKKSIKTEKGEYVNVWVLEDEKKENTVDIYFDVTLPTKRMKELRLIKT